MKALLGFDGFVDKLAKVIEKRDKNGEHAYASIPDFAVRIADAAGISCDLELRTISVLPGGNAPNMAKGLGALGVDTTLIAAIGEESLHPAFTRWEKYCKMIPVGEPSDTLALEFGDGKVMMADLSPFEGLTWKHIIETVGMAKLLELADECDMYALTCYSLLPHAAEIYDGFRRDVLEKLPHRSKKPLIFFDLADVSKHSAAMLQHCAEVLRAYRPYGETVLGMNVNETNCMTRAFGISDACTVQERLAALYQTGIADVLLSHPRDRCYVADTHGVREIMGVLVESPRISTGGGDHLNAGFCAAKLQGFSNDEAAVSAMKVSRCFVETGAISAENIRKYEIFKR